MFISDVLKFMYPGIDERKFILEKMADGSYTIIHWDASLGPQPTQPEIDAAIPAAKAALAMSAIRAERGRRLAATDYMAMPDYPSPPAGLAAYRKALRDFPATVNAVALSWPVDISALNWPVLGL